MLRISLLLSALALGLNVCAAEEIIHGKPSAANATAFLKQRCFDCHGNGADEGGVAFDDLTNVTVENAEVWKVIWEQVALKEMPPADHDSQPSPHDRVVISSWITEQMAVALKDVGGFTSHLHPLKGNHLDHDLLFGPLPEDLEPPSTPARICRVHPLEHLTRLSSLINKEPAFDPAKPGLRSYGDAVPANEEGEIKVYYGLDRLLGWVGGTAAYAAAITGFPPMLSLDDNHGLRSYPAFYSVNGAEATQIASNAEDILRFMAWGPNAEPYQFAKRVADVKRPPNRGDIRGLAESLTYGLEPKRPLTPVYEMLTDEELAAGGPSEAKRIAAIEFLFEALTGRPPANQETNAYLAILNEAIDDLGPKDGSILGLVPVFLDREALFRTELTADGKPDKHGRVMLSGSELVLAINAAFGYLPPDDALWQALADGRLKTRDDVQREVTRILNDDAIRKPRVLQFFREYFDYDRAGDICKDTRSLNADGGLARDYYLSMVDMTVSTDRLIELIVAEDRDVLKELLTTDRVVFNRNGHKNYFGEWVGKGNKKPQPEPKDKKKRRNPTSSQFVEPADLPAGDDINVRIARVVQGARKNPARELTTLPANQRRGILTHPSWLVSHSDAMDNHAILRGRWVRERLLGDAVPDVPITVDAMLPDEPKETLRHRMRVTRNEYCWKCHRKMDPLGLPFEMFNQLGIYRTQEKGQPVDASGAIIDSGDPSLDGPVDNALDMIDKLAASERVEQVFVRHAFRFWLGRNETLSDAPVIQAAWQAYRDNNGSMNALLTSLLTSDAFLYRKIEPMQSGVVSR